MKNDTHLNVAPPKQINGHSLIKAHIETYTKKDGTVVQAHDTKTQKRVDEPLKTDNFGAGFTKQFRQEATWNHVSKHLSNTYHWDREEVRNFLDSKSGRHLAEWLSQGKYTASRARMEVGIDRFMNGSSDSAYYHAMGEHPKTLSNGKPMAKAIPVIAIVTNRPDTSPYKINSDCIEFRPRRVIDVPTEFADDELTARWELALHEAGHAIAAQQSVGVGGMGVNRLGGLWTGVCFDTAHKTLPTYQVAIAGVAGEALGVNWAYLPFACSDFECARDELRARGDTEESIVHRIASDTSAMIDEFAARWTKAIRELSIQVCKRSWLNADQIAEIMGTSQAALTKSFPANDINHKWIDTRPLRKAFVLHPRVMRDAGLVPVAQLQAKRDMTALHKSISELATKVKLEAERVPGKREVVLFKARRLDFGQTPWHQKPESLFKERK